MNNNWTNYNRTKSQWPKGTYAKGEGNVGSGTKKAVKHFTDLEVYQKSLEAAVFVCKMKNKNKNATAEIIRTTMTNCALSIPHLIAESHSMRFGTSEASLLVLDKVMLNCNKMVVYLEQARDICSTGLETDQFAEQIKKYFFIRQKVLNLQRVWRKYIEINKLEKPN